MPLPIYAEAVIEDELVEAIRGAVSGRSVPEAATREAIAETEAASGYPLPPLLTRLFTEVANGGFGPNGAVYGVRGHNWHKTDLFPDMTEAALAAVADPDWSQRRWCLPLIDWGCAISTMIDCREPSGPLWGWDPNLCCLDHAFFPLDQNLASMLAEALTAQYPEPFYPGYFADLRKANSECAPTEWTNGRINPGSG
jgi:hypothetical protein